MNENKEAINKFLIEEGFRPKYDEDGDIIFKQEGDTYYISFRDNDEDFASIKKLGRIDIDDNEIFDVYKILNKVNSEYIIGKCTLVNDDKILAFDIDYLGSIDKFTSNFERYLRIIKQMEKDFLKEYSNI